MLAKHRGNPVSQYLRHIFRPGKGENPGKYTGSPPQTDSRQYYPTLLEANTTGVQSLTDLEQQMTKMDLKQTLYLLRGARRKIMQPQTIDCSKALIFVIGNLDEAYPMHQDSSPHMNPDYLHRRSSKIGITHVNKALKKRFRSEEIARLGNNHNIYPALRKQDFIAIIKKDIERLKKQIEKKRAFRWKWLLRLKPLIA